MLKFSRMTVASFDHEYFQMPIAARYMRGWLKYFQKQLTGSQNTYELQYHKDSTLSESMTLTLHPKNDRHAPANYD